MSDIISIEHLHREFKNTTDLKAFAETQMRTLISLQEVNKKLQDEIDHLKSLLISTTPILGQGAVEKVIVSPERALVEDQILMIQHRSYGQELSLEDVKKLDILLKHSRILKQADSDMQGESKKVTLSKEELLKIVHETK